MTPNRIFVSGGSGVIGLELIPMLIERGATVLVGDLKPLPASFDSKVQYRHGDLNQLTREEIAAFAPEQFIHLAATFERSTESYEFWKENFQHNVRLSHHLMSLMKDLPSLRRVVFASSYLIYDPHLYQFDNPQAAAVALRETDAIAPRNLTGMAKLAHETELRFLAEFRSAHFTSVCARIFRGYGRNSRDVISRWIREVLLGKPVTLYRAEGLFDYVYARDSADGIARLADASSISGIVNLGTGRARRVQDVIDVLRGHFPSMQVVQGDADIPFEASVADIGRLKAMIGWSPRYDLETAIPEIIAHERRALHDGTAAKRTPRIVVSSASRKAPLIRAMQAAVRRIDLEGVVVAADVDPGALTAHAADDFWVMPATLDGNVGAVLDGCLSRGITHVLPTRDGELEFWATHANRFREAGIDVVVSALPSVRRCLDKLAFSQFGRDRNLPIVPATLKLDELSTRRYVVKERFGAGSRAVGLDLDSVAAREHASTLAHPIYQPYVMGSEISVDAWLDRQYALRGLVLRRREKVVGGESQVTATFRDSRIEASTADILTQLELRGPVVLQAIIEPSGSLQVIECNARFGGASTAAIAVGLDGLYWSIWECREAGEAPVFRRLGAEVRQVRLPADHHVYDPDLRPR